MKITYLKITYLENKNFSSSGQSWHFRCHLINANVSQGSVNGSLLWDVNSDDILYRIPEAMHVLTLLLTRGEHEPTTTDNVSPRTASRGRGWQVTLVPDMLMSRRQDPLTLPTTIERKHPCNAV